MVGLALLLPGLAAAWGGPAAPPRAEAERLFAVRVWPLLAAKCLACHGQDGKTLGELDLRTPRGVLRGGKRGKPVLTAGQPEASPLYLAATRAQPGRWPAMPPKENDRLTAADLEAVRRWIAGGAPWPDVARRAELARAPASAGDATGGVPVRTSGGLTAEWTARRYKPGDLWAFRPLVGVRGSATQRVPGIRQGANPVDAFIDTRLSRLGLKPAPPADPRTLIRRVTFDLTGLPPTPEEVEAFVRESSSSSSSGGERRRTEPSNSGGDRGRGRRRGRGEPPNAAYIRLVDRLLASPHYGERWGRYWLDVVRYADSSGYSNDYERGNAWRYRDYVIRSFNEDKPYDRFVREQIAGDELAPDDPEMRVAVGFLRMGPWELTGMEVARVARQRFLDDVTDSVGQVFLAQPLQCARCHDHKFDPIPTRDYYRVQAAFATTQLAEREAPFLKTENTSGFEERRLLEKRRDSYLALLERLDEKALAAAEQWYREKGLDPAPWQRALAEARGRAGGRGPSLFSDARGALLRGGMAESGFPPQHVGFEPEDLGLERIARKGLERLRWELERYEPFAFSVYSGRTPDLRSVSAPLRVPAGSATQGELEEVSILAGGDPFAPTRKVEPGVLSAVEACAGHAGPLPASLEGRRRALADWIASPKNPLTARVIVNRVWQGHFGRGLAANPNNFGASGGKPSHPDLLDYLAWLLTRAATSGRGGVRVIGSLSDWVPNQPTQSPKHPITPSRAVRMSPTQPPNHSITQSPAGLAWSLKRLHRLILTSQAYQRAARHPDAAAVGAKDPEGTSYAVFRPRRLTAEELRDSMLAVSGELNRQVGGIPARPEIHLEAALQPRQVMGTFAAAWEPAPRPEQRHRRSVYVLKLRGLRDPFAEVFNEPGPDLSCERREVSTVTPQVFALFNSRDASSRALALASRLRKEGGSRESIVRRAFALAFGRAPDARELRDTLAHWDRMTARHRTLIFAPPVYPREVEREAVEENTGVHFRFKERLHAYDEFVPDLQPAGADAETRGLAEVCLALLNSNEFAHVY